MVIVEEGKRAVWEHCKEAGIDGDIAMIAKHFDIKDICLIYNGKMTYIEQRPRKVHRIAVAAQPSKSLAEYLKEARGKK